MYELMSSNGTKERKKNKTTENLKKNSNVHGPFRVVKIEEIE